MDQTTNRQTLPQFAATLDGIVGEHVPFAETALALATVRARKAAVEAHRALIYAMVKERHAAGDRTGEEYTLRAVTQRGADSVLTVTSDRVKKASPTLWSRSRVLKPRVSVTPPGKLKAALAFTSEGAVGLLPSVPSPTSPLDQLCRAYEECTPKALTTFEAQYVDDLRKIAADIGWDGQPIKFADGWKVGLAVLTFDGDRLRELDPASWDRLAEVRDRSAISRVCLRKVGAVEDAEDDEIDGE